jgi:hypothetical protein
MIDVDHGGGPLAPALWFLVAEAGHVGCGGWTVDRHDGHLRCACGTVLYEFREVDGPRDHPPAPADRASTAAPAEPAPTAAADGLGPFHTTFPEIVTAMLSLRVPCPWCGADVDQPCTLPGGVRPLRKTLAHPARLDAVGPVLVEQPRREQHVR